MMRRSGHWLTVINDKALKHLHNNHPTICLQNLFVCYSDGLMLDFKLHAVKFSKYDYAEGFGISLSSAKKKLVDKIYGLDRKVDVCTVNKEEDMVRLIGLGVDGLISNYPDKAKQLVPNK